MRLLSARGCYADARRRACCANARENESFIINHRGAKMPLVLSHRIHRSALDDAIRQVTTLASSARSIDNSISLSFCILIVCSSN
jgi:hypothetical protein